MKWTFIFLWVFLLLPTQLLYGKDLTPKEVEAKVSNTSIDTDILTALAVVQCESDFKPNVWGDLDKPYPSYGIAQFQHRTFRWLALKAGRPDLKWKDPKDQMWLLIWSIKHNYGYLWTCYRKLIK